MKAMKTIYLLAALLVVGVACSQDARADRLHSSLVATGASVAVQQADPERRRERRGDSRNRRSDERRDDRRDDWRDDRRDDRWDDRLDRRLDRIDDRRDERWERYWRYRIGVRLLSLPARHTRVTIGTTVYYYADGVYLVRRGGGYVVVRSPVGARVAFLPYGFRSVWVGPRRYFYVNSTYYVYAPSTRDYVVVAPPSGADAQVQAMSPDPIVYPAQGQSQEQIDLDRFECHRFAMGESGFDPTRGEQDARADRAIYDRAIKACLTGRGYTVE